MPTIRFAYPTEDGMWGAEDHDEHQRTRERVRGLAELSPEATAYEVTQAIRSGRMSEYRDELDWRENARLYRAAKVILASAAVLATAAMAAVVWVMVQ